MDKKYRIVRDSKTGRMEKIKFAVTTTATLAAIGVVSLFTVFSKESGQNYKYDSTNPATYSEQIENMLDVNLESDLEECINKFQNISVFIDEYQNSEGFLMKSHACDNLVQNYSEIGNTSLELLKRIVASEHGGDADEYSIGYEKSDNSWIASNQEVGAITLTGEERSLADSIGQLQNYQSVDFEKLDMKAISQYVQVCSQVLDDSVFLATNKSEKAQNTRKP